MKLVLVTGQDELDLDFTIASDDVTVASLIEAVSEAGLLAETVLPEMGLVIEGQFFGPQVAVRTCDIRSGSRISLGIGPSPPGTMRSTIPIAEVRVVGGFDAGDTRPLLAGRTMIGRSRVVVDRSGAAFVDGNAVAAGHVIDLGPQKIVVDRVSPPDSAPLGPPNLDGIAVLHRSPRPAPLLAPAPVRPPAEVPPPAPALRFSWAAIAAPVVFGAVMAMVFSPVMAAFAVFGPVMALGNWMEDKRRLRRERRAANEARVKEDQRYRADVAAAEAAELARLRALLPDPAEVVRRALQRSVRLWERRPHHDDFLMLALADGEGVDARPGHTVGIAGSRKRALALARSLVLQAVVHHGPADVRLAVHTTTDDWHWCNWLPHLDDDVGPNFVVIDGDHSHLREIVPADVSVIVIADVVARLPAFCTTVVDVDHPSASCAGISAATARPAAMALAALDDPEVSHRQAELPTEIALVDLLRTCSATEASLSVPIGVGAGGAPLELDLVADGPHALVAGTTGSGKSELLRTLVAGLASTYGPDEVTFVLIDYKGGSAFGECAGLPHTVGFVTDLDEHLGRRALRSLEAEIRFRERLVRAAGVADIIHYDGVLPRLVVVVDEFATLAAELPDFIDALVSVAQRGRSLGIHLVLATQRPSGTVSGHVKANTNIRIALRVQDGPDSHDVVGTADAATIDRHRPGRAMLRLGHGEVKTFQAALVTARRVRVAPKVVVRPLGQEPAVASQPETGETDLADLVASAVASAQRRGIDPPRRPWVEPLPLTVELDELPTVADTAVFGLADDPDGQRRVPYGWRLGSGNLAVYGVITSGMPTPLLSIALALVRSTTPDQVHLYAVDFGNQTLATLTDVPHCGAFIAARERDRLERLIRFLNAEVDRRRHGDRPPWPHVVVLMENYGGFHAAFDDLASLAMREQVTRVIADGSSVGVHVAVSADRPSALPMSVASTIPHKLVLRLADPNDVALLGLSPRALPAMPPGRGIDVASGLEVQVADAGQPQPRVGTVVVHPHPIGRLPDEVDALELIGAASMDDDEWFLPIGIGDTELAPVGFSLAEGDSVLVAGPPRSGRSAVLVAVADLVSMLRPDVKIGAVTPRRSPLREHPSITHDIADAQMVLVDDADAVDHVDLPPAARVIVSGRADVLRTSYSHWTASVRRSRRGLLLRPQVEVDGELWQTALPRRPVVGPAGRGLLVADGQVEVVQVAMRSHGRISHG
jgi:DNA segregation ATPase FtsK/SpoIIIE, S-DNA-T family